MENMTLEALSQVLNASLQVRSYDASLSFNEPQDMDKL